MRLEPGSPEMKNRLGETDSAGQEAGRDWEEAEKKKGPPEFSGGPAWIPWTSSPHSGFGRLEVKEDRVPAGGLRPLGVVWLRAGEAARGGELVTELIEVGHKVGLGFHSAAIAL